MALDYLLLTVQDQTQQCEQNICCCYQHQVISVSTLGLTNAKA